MKGIPEGRLKSLASMRYYDVRTKSIDVSHHHCEHVTGDSPSPSSVRHFLLTMTARAIGASVQVSGCSAIPTMTAPVPRASRNQRISTEQTVTNGPAGSGHNDFWKSEEQQFWKCIEE